MPRTPAFFLFAFFSVYLFSQDITINLTPKDGRYPRTFSVEAANHDPGAKTPEQVFAVNKTMAEAGDTQAAYELGLAYLQGYGVAQDLVAAEHWFKIGAVDPGQKSLVASMYQYGDFFPKDMAKAAEWLTAAGRPSDLFAMAELSRMAHPQNLEIAIPLYLRLLQNPAAPEYRRAQMELGNLVIDSKYSAGDDEAGRSKNLEWARVITQELLGQQLYDMAVDFSAGRAGVKPDQAMWLRYCRRAAAYNIDLAQRFLAEEIAKGEDPQSPRNMALVWLRLASEKQTSLKAEVEAINKRLNESQRDALEVLYQQELAVRLADGALYPQGDPLRGVSADALARMDGDDPNVMLRRAFALEQLAIHDPHVYEEAMQLYRTVRDDRIALPRLYLSKLYLTGGEGIQPDQKKARLWLQIATDRGSMKAKELLKK